MYNKQFLLLFGFYISYLWFTTFSNAILPTHFLQQGLTLSQIMIGSFLGNAGQTLLLLTVKKLSSKLAWRLAILSWLFYLLLIITIHNAFQFYIASVVSGFTVYLFFVFYNIAHFEKTPKENRGHGSALMFVMPTFIGIFAPIIAGYITQINIIFLWLISFCSFFIALYMVNFQDNFTINYTIKAALQEIKATRVLIFIEGVWEALVFGIIPIYTLFFIKTPLNYGIFLSYLSLVSIVANLTLGKLTDKLQKRVIFLYPLTIIMALTTFFFSFATKNLTLWIIAISIIQFLLPLFWNVSTALIVDAHPSLRIAFPGREIVLAVGRVTGLLFASISFIFEKSPSIIFIVLGLTLLLYPTVIYWNTNISKKYTYL